MNHPREVLTSRERVILRECVRALAEGLIVITVAPNGEPLRPAETDELLQALEDEGLMLLVTTEQKLFSVPCRLDVLAGSQEEAAAAAGLFLSGCIADADAVQHFAVCPPSPT